MGSTSRKLSDEELKTINSEHTDLLALAEKQTAEQRAYLALHIGSDTNADLGLRSRLVDMLTRGEGYVVRMFRTTDANVMHQSTVQLTVDIDDELFLYLHRADNALPRELRGFLDGGIDTTAASRQNVATDPNPLIGKTKTGVVRFDQ